MSGNESVFISFEWFSYLGSAIAAGVSALTAIRRDRPRILKINELGTSISYERDLRIEEKEIEIHWGRLDYRFLPIFSIINGNGRLTSLMSRIFVNEIPKNANPEFYYYQFDKLEENLPKFSYIVVNNFWENKKKIYLEKRKFYLRNKIQKIFIIIKTELDQTFRNNVTHYIKTDHLEIINQNRLPVIDYIIDLPFTITRDYIDESNNHIYDVRVVRDSSSPTGNHIQLTIQSIPPKKIDQFGRLKIPFKKPVPF